MSILFCRLLDNTDNSTDSYPVIPVNKQQGGGGGSGQNKAHNHNRGGGGGGKNKRPSRKKQVMIQLPPRNHLHDDHQGRGRGGGERLDYGRDNDRQSPTIKSCGQCRGRLSQDLQQPQHLMVRYTTTSSSSSSSHHKPDVLFHTRGGKQPHRNSDGTMVVGGLRRSHSLSQFQIQNNSTPDIIAVNSCA